VIDLHGRLDLVRCMNCLAIVHRADFQNESRAAKLYELIGDGRVTTTTVGRRRLVIVQSLLALVGVKATLGDRG
jgi:hypothetical protein